MSDTMEDSCKNKRCMWLESELSDLKLELSEYRKSAPFFEEQALAWQHKYEACKKERNDWRNAADDTREKYEAALAKREEVEIELNEKIIIVENNAQIVEEIETKLENVTADRDNSKCALEMLKAQYSNLKLCKESLDKECVELFSAKKTLDKEIALLKDAKESLETKNELLNRAKDSMERENTFFSDAKDVAIAAKEAAETENSVLSSTRASLQKELDELKRVKNLIESDRNDLMRAKESLEQDRDEVILANRECQSELDSVKEELVAMKQKAEDAENSVLSRVYSMVHSQCAVLA